MVSYRKSGSMVTLHPALRMAKKSSLIITDLSDQRLLKKLKAYGVVVNRTYSQWNAVTSGIPHSSVLGQILFIIYISDLPTTAESMVHFFADDTKIYMKIATENDCIELQNALDILQEWSNISLIQNIQFISQYSYILLPSSVRKVLLNFTFAPIVLLSRTTSA